MKKHGLTLTVFLILILTFSISKAQPPSIEKAKEEGQVLLYGTMQISQMRVVIDAFEKKYPFLKVKHYRTNSDKLVQKVFTEVRAGRHLADVYQIRGTRLMRLQRAGLLSHFESPERKYIRDIYKDTKGYWAGVYANLEFIGYNTELVRPEDVPKSHKDLLNPKWKGKIALDTSDVEWYITQIHVLGEEKAKDFMKKFAQQDIQLRRGHTLLAQLLAAGEFAMIMTLRDNTAYNMMKNGAPIDWVAMEPVIPNPPNGISLPRQPPHPNAGKLFVNFMLSKEGQRVMRSLGRNITRTDVDPVSERVKSLKYGKIDWGDYIGNYNRYEKDFRGFFNIPN